MKFEGAVFALLLFFAGSNNQKIQATKAAGYDNGAIYEFIYTAKSPTVMGIGFAAVRDIVSFLPGYALVPKDKLCKGTCFSSFCIPGRPVAIRS
jgi:hypothetical protein